MPDQIIFSYPMDKENMLFGRPLPFVKDYPGSLDDALKRYYPGAELSPVQKSRLNFCITGIPATNSLCCAKFKRASLKACSLGDYILCLAFIQPNKILSLTFLVSSD